MVQKKLKMSFTEIDEYEKQQREVDWKQDILTLINSETIWA